MPETFLGRHFDNNTATWIYSDGSGGAMPEEVRLEVMATLSDPREGSFLRFFNPVWRWKASRK